MALSAEAVVTAQATGWPQCFTLVYLFFPTVM
jgi:hypothetical protein